MRNIFFNELLNILNRIANVDIISEDPTQDNKVETLYSGKLKDMSCLLCFDFMHCIIKEIFALEHNHFRVVIYCTGFYER